MATYASLLKTVHSNITSYQDIATIYKKLEDQRYLVHLAELINQIFAEEHEFTVKELSKYVQESENDQTEEEFFEEQYELNSNIFRKNLALITSNMVEEIGKLYIERFKLNQKKDQTNGSGILDNTRSPVADKTQYSNRNELPEIREENEERASPATGRNNHQDPRSSQKGTSTKKSQDRNPVTESEEPTAFEAEANDPRRNLEQIIEMPDLTQLAKTLQEAPKAEEKGIFSAEIKRGRYVEAPEKEDKVNAMLAQRSKNQESRNYQPEPVPHKSFDIREIQNKLPVTQDGTSYEYPTYAPETFKSSLPSSYPNSGLNSHVNSAMNSANRQINSSNPYPYNIHYQNKKPEEKLAEPKDRPKSSHRSTSSEKNIPKKSQSMNTTLNIPPQKESSRLTKSPSDKFRETNKSSSSPLGHSFSRYSAQSNGPDPSVLDSEFSYTKGQSFSKSKRKLHEEPGIKPGPGSYQVDEGDSQVSRRSPSNKFAKAAKKTIFETVRTESPGHIYYPTQHFISK